MKLYQYELQFDKEHKKLKRFKKPNDFNAGIHPRGVENDYIVKIESDEVNVC